MMFRNMIRKTCVQQFGHTVVGETDSGLQAVELISKLKPDAVILDLSLRDMDGLNVAEKAFAALPQLKIIVLSAHCDDYTLFRVEKSGVHGFIDKNSNPVE